MGHVSEAFRGSLALPLVSANHSCNWEQNLFHDFNQTQTAGSIRSWGRMIRLPQRYQAKTDNKLELKTLVTAQWHGNPLRSQCEWKVCEKCSAIALFSGQIPYIFQALSKTQFLILLVVSHWNFGLRQKLWSDWQQTFGADSWQRRWTFSWKRADRQISTAPYLLPPQGRWIGHTSECKDGGVLSSLSEAKSLSEERVLWENKRLSFLLWLIQVGRCCTLCVGLNCKRQWRFLWKASS